MQHNVQLKKLAITTTNLVISTEGDTRVPYIILTLFTLKLVIGFPLMTAEEYNVQGRRSLRKSIKLRVHSLPILLHRKPHYVPLDQGFCT